MGNHARIESSEVASFLTTRSRNSELWFVNNPDLEEAILEYAAKYSTTREVKLYGLAIEGNHIQAPAHFPKENRGDFMRDLNSNVAKSVKRFCPEYPGGTFWERRYSNEFLPGDEDIEEYFFYTVLQPVQDGLVERLSDYPGYNCFHDAVHGIGRDFRLLDRKAFHAARKRNPSTPIKDFYKTYTLKYQRLPGYEDLSQRDYALLMQKKLEQRRVQIVNTRKAEGKGFLGRARLLQVRPGTRPLNTKTSTRDSHRPRILSICPIRRAEYRAWYFNIYFAYKEASLRYRSGELLTEFPKGTYRPYCKYASPLNLPQ